MTATQDVLTPTVRRSVRRSMFWVSMVIVGLLVTLALVLLTRGSGVEGPPLSPASAAPNGSMALAEVLRNEGVNVTHATSLAAAQAALVEHPDATVFVVDAREVLDGRQLDRLQRASSHLVVMAPAYAQLEGFVNEISPAGNVDGVLEADCPIAAVAAAERVTGDGVGYRLVDELPGATACLDSGTDVKSLIQIERGGSVVTVIGTVSAFTNEQVGLVGNAALALWLLGTSDELVWYESNIADAAVPGAPTIGELTPPWVSAAIVLFGLSIVALALWKGRRFGPLVVENLPVTVRASETMEGRARLYEKSASRMHALDTLRVGAISRLAALAGLGRSATVDDVVYSVANLVDRDERPVRDLLIDAVTHTDAQLMSLSDGLLELERAVAARLGTARTNTNTTSSASTASTGSNPRTDSTPQGE